MLWHHDGSNYTVFSSPKWMSGISLRFAGARSFFHTPRLRIEHAVGELEQPQLARARAQPVKLDAGQLRLPLGLVEAGQLTLSYGPSTTAWLTLPLLPPWLPLWLGLLALLLRFASFSWESDAMAACFPFATVNFAASPRFVLLGVRCVGRWFRVCDSLLCGFA